MALLVPACQAVSTHHYVLWVMMSRRGSLPAFVRENGKVSRLPEVMGYDQPRQAWKSTSAVQFGYILYVVDPVTESSWGRFAFSVPLTCEVPNKQKFQALLP